MLKIITKILSTVSLIVCSSTVNASLITDDNFAQLTTQYHLEQLGSIESIVVGSQDNIVKEAIDYITETTKSAVKIQTMDSLTIGTTYLLELYYTPCTERHSDNSLNVYWDDIIDNFGLDKQPDYIVDNNRRLASLKGIK